jgi:hypothetical protein
VAQIGAVAGREFHYELLSAVAGLPSERLEEALGQLVESELIFRRGEIPHAVYTFRHTLVRDAAYAGLLKSRRGHLHAAIANALEQQFPEEAAAWEKDPYTFAPVGGESGLTVTARALPVLMDIVRAHSSGNVLVVSHKATIRLLLSSILGFDPRRYRDNLDQNPAALNIVDFKDPVNARLTLFNDTSHYAEAGLASIVPHAHGAGGHRRLRRCGRSPIGPATSGVLVAMTPAAVQSGSETLSKPTAWFATIFSWGPAAARSSASTFSVSIVTRAS